MSSSKLHVRVGESEFTAEGPQDIVQKQYEQWLEAIRSQPSIQPKNPALPPLPGNGKNGNGHATPLDTELLPRAFIVDDKGLVSLRVKPSTDQRDADGLLLLLYGYRVLQNQNDVLSMRLKLSATQSGISSEKPSLALAKYKQYVTVGGDRRGAKYGLNNPGVAKAEELLKGLFG